MTNGVFLDAFGVVFTLAAVGVVVVLQVVGVLGRSFSFKTSCYFLFKPKVLSDLRFCAKSA